MVRRSESFGESGNLHPALAARFPSSKILAPDPESFGENGNLHPALAARSPSSKILAPDPALDARSPSSKILAPDPAKAEGVDARGYLAEAVRAARKGIVLTPAGYRAYLEQLSHNVDDQANGSQRPSG